MTTKCNDISFGQVDISFMRSTVMIDFAFLHALFFLIVVKLSFFSPYGLPVCHYR